MRHAPLQPGAAEWGALALSISLHILFCSSLVIIFAPTLNTSKPVFIFLGQILGTADFSKPAEEPVRTESAGRQPGAIRMGAAKTLSVENRAIVKPSFTQGTMKANKAHQKDMSFALPLPEEKQDEKSAASTFDLPGPKRIPFRLEP